jgi:hypothetical protein
VGLTHGDEAVAATTARALARLTADRSPGAPRAYRGNRERRAGTLLPRIECEPTDLLIVAFGVNDATAYNSPAAFADGLAELVNRNAQAYRRCGRRRCGCRAPRRFPALPWPLRNILGWRSVALQAAADGLTARLPRLVVERFSEPFVPDLFFAATDSIPAGGRTRSGATRSRRWRCRSLAEPLLRAGSL